MGFVLVQHLAPTHVSMLAELLSRATKMPVSEVEDEPVVEPNQIYVIPPDKNMVIANGRLELSAREMRAPHRPIDHFFRSLADDRGHTAIGVVLSGSATDGTLGLGEIKAAGGITFAQDETAQHTSMPQSAIAAGCVDYVLPPDEIAKELAHIARHPFIVPAGEQPLHIPREPNLVQILEMLHRATGVDFSNYKRNTLIRRISRRMVLHKMDGLKEYVRLLQSTPAELDALYQDVLIGVTSFFRNPESYEVLKARVFPELVKDRSRHDLIRVWVLGCSTGEEAYSLAMCLTEFQETIKQPVPAQIFATDLNGAAIEKARAGVYSKNLVQDVSPERLRRFFIEADGRYQISKPIRDMCVFARHNVLTDPPFSHLDLVSCRNLLIYLEPVLQQKLVPLLHYALKPRGFLWLGHSETIGSYRNYFEMVDSRHKIYARKPSASRLPPGLPLREQVLDQRGGAQATPRRESNAGPDPHKEADRLLLSTYAPPGVLINADFEVLQFRGDTGLYLTPPPGKASYNLLKMLRPGLLVAVRGAIHRAKREQAPSAKKTCASSPTAASAASTSRSCRSSRTRALAAFWCSSRMPMPAPAPNYQLRPRHPLPPSRKRPSATPPASSRSWPPPANICSRSSSSKKPPTRSSSPPTKRSSPPTRSCRASTRSWKPPRKRSSRATRSWPPSTTS
jgi:two-component system CheB/CheR fusion protein